jgi:hypothetical protein
MEAERMKARAARALSDAIDFSQADLGPSSHVSNRFKNPLSCTQGPPYGAQTPDLDMKQANRIEDRFVLLRT